MSSFTAIPSVDFADFLSGEESRKRKFVRELGEAYREVGFVAMTNHGIDQDLIDKFLALVKEFSQLPLKAKKSYEAGGMRGYIAMGVEHAEGSKTGDLKEMFQFGPEVEDNPALRAEYPENVFVEDLPEYTPTGLKLFRNFQESGRKLLGALALYLDLEENYFDHKIHNGHSILRAIYSPPITEEPKDAVRAAEHTDICLITLLLGADTPGLQVMNHDGDWVAAEIAPDQIVVNVGNMLERLCNSRLISTKHRVVNPPHELWHLPRISIPFFLQPRPEMDLSCLSSCVNEEHPKKFEGITSGQFLNRRLVSIGLKKED